METSVDWDPSMILDEIKSMREQYDQQVSSVNDPASNIHQELPWDFNLYIYTVFTWFLQGFTVARSNHCFTTDLINQKGSTPFTSGGILAVACSTQTGNARE